MVYLKKHSIQSEVLHSYKTKQNTCYSQQDPNADTNSNSNF